MKHGLFEYHALITWYPLVNSHIAMERSTIETMGKSTISMVIFNSYVAVYQRVFLLELSGSGAMAARTWADVPPLWL